jgi:type I restriction enzyme R subunit
MDFKRATALFADPDFDGDPVQVYEPRAGESPVPPDEPGPGGEVPPDPGDVWGGEGEPPGVREPAHKYYVDDVAVRVVSERVQYLGADGKLITESLRKRGSNQF